MDLKRAGLLAGLGLIISLLGFIPGAGPVISLIGDVLYLTGVYYISKHADKSIFTYILISTILSFVAMIISTFSHLASATGSFVLGIRHSRNNRDLGFRNNRSDSNREGLFPSRSKLEYAYLRKSGENVQNRRIHFNHTDRPRIHNNWFCDVNNRFFPNARKAILKFSSCLGFVF